MVRRAGQARAADVPAAHPDPLMASLPPYEFERPAELTDAERGYADLLLEAAEMVDQLDLAASRGDVGTLMRTRRRQEELPALLFEAEIRVLRLRVDHLDQCRAALRAPTEALVSERDDLQGEVDRLKEQLALYDLPLGDLHGRWHMLSAQKGDAQRRIDELVASLQPASPRPRKIASARPS